MKPATEILQALDNLTDCDSVAEYQENFEIVENFLKELMARSSEPVATVRVVHGGYGMVLSTFVAYALQEGTHELFAQPTTNAQPLTCNRHKPCEKLPDGYCARCHSEAYP